MFAGMGAGRRLDRCRASSKARCLNCQTQPWPGRCLVLVSPSHGENRGSSPLGSANKLKHLYRLHGICFGVFLQLFSKSRTELATVLLKAIAIAVRVRALEKWCV